MTPTHLLWLLLSAEPVAAIAETHASAEILDPVEITFSVGGARADDATASPAPAAEELLVGSPDQGAVPVTTYSPKPIMVNAVSVSISGADAPAFSGDGMEGVVAVIAQFN